MYPSRVTITPEPRLRSLGVKTLTTAAAAFFATGAKLVALLIAPASGVSSMTSAAAGLAAFSAASAEGKARHVAAQIPNATSPAGRAPARETFHDVFIIWHRFCVVHPATRFEKAL